MTLPELALTTAVMLLPQPTNKRPRSAL